MEEGEYRAAAEALRPMLVETARSYLRDTAAAEDMAQETLMRMWQMHDALHSPVEALARTIVRNLALDYLRRRKPLTDIGETDIAAEETDTDHERYRRIMSIIATLPALQQTVLRLRLTEGREYAEIAELTGIKQTALRKIVSRARFRILTIYNEMNI
jgi:RNA polymerase sigma-70 factor (ECF subfamily)